MKVIFNLIAYTIVVRYFSVLFTDPVYEADFIYKADILPNGQ